MNLVNPQGCPCGYFNHPRQPCTCTPPLIARYLAKISGPLLDRIDLQVEVPALSPEKIATTSAGEPSAAIRNRSLPSRPLNQICVRNRFRSNISIEIRA
jgi:magnesium chelatase family protein